MTGSWLLWPHHSVGTPPTIWSLTTDEGSEGWSEDNSQCRTESDKTKKGKPKSKKSSQKLLINWDAKIEKLDARGKKSNKIYNNSLTLKINFIKQPDKDFSLGH
jgi:hypothetical protein